MIENAFRGDKRYWAWIVILVAVIGTGVLAWFRQFNTGLTVTGLSRDVAWGFYIAQFTFMVGVAASAVMIVLPYYLHNYKEFGKLTVLGEYIAVASCMMCMMFIFVDMGMPFRIINVFLYPSPNSMMFWDTVVLSGYLMINLLIAVVSFQSERKGIKPPKWTKPIIILSIPWAISIHTVTAFLYSGLAGRPFWMSAVLAPRFLATAFAAGPALLILLMLLLRKVGTFDVGDKALKKLSIIVTYAMTINIFFILMEVFTAAYSGIPEHLAHFKFLYLGLDGNTAMVPWMWTSSILAVISLLLLYVPKMRNNPTVLGWACVAVFMSIWIDKGLGMVVTGFTPNVMGDVVAYMPTLNELLISFGVYGIGAMIITLLYKTTLDTRARLG